MSNRMAARSIEDRYYRNHKEEISHRRIAHVKLTKEIIRQLKDVPCLDCGKKFPPVCMDFDHRNSNDKRFSVGSSLTYKLETILAEIAKCDIVCANCHRIRTSNREGN